MQNFGIALISHTAIMPIMTMVKQQPAVLYARRLTLRPFAITDAPRLARITNDPLITRNLLRTATPFSAEDARTLILRVRRKHLPVWGIDNGQLIGLIGLAGEFGLWLARSSWGNGYGEEAGRLVIGHAFSTLGMSELHANPIAGNLTSRRLLAKLGFGETGRSHAYCKQRDMIVPLITFRLIRQHRWRHQSAKAD